jgi:peptidoglycan hydrolase-like protein with peptidoglycan-binding domain
MPRTGLTALLAALALVAALAVPAPAEPAPAREAAEAWPVPVPAWFWPWARWYLGRAEFADQPFRSEGTRPDAAPRDIPDWAWRRLEALLTPGRDTPRPQPAQRTVRTWPVPLPQWFWVWARWYLGRAEFADDGPQAPEVRPPAAPRYIPAWAWQRLRVLQGGEPTQPPDEALERGDEGPAVEAMQRALNGARYVAGPADGVYGTKTRYGVVAFQKANGFEPDGVVGPEEWVRIMRELRPSPPLGSPDDYVYVDLDRQILFDVQGGTVRRVLPVSTGGRYWYTGLDGERHLAVTPTGSFEVFRKVAGKDRSYLGTLYYPSYFTNGYAIHGSQSVPAEPVSHGCVRIPLWLAQDVFERMQIGTPVIVAG